MFYLNCQWRRKYSLNIPALGNNQGSKNSLLLFFHLQKCWRNWKIKPSVWRDHVVCGVLPHLVLFVSSFLLAELSSICLRRIYWKRISSQYSILLLLSVTSLSRMVSSPPPWSYFADVPSISSSYSSRWLVNFSMTLSNWAQALLWQGIEPYKFTSKLYVLLCI